MHQKKLRAEPDTQTCISIFSWVQSYENGPVQSYIQKNKFCHY